MFPPVGAKEDSTFSFGFACVFRNRKQPCRAKSLNSEPLGLKKSKKYTFKKTIKYKNGHFATLKTQLFHPATAFENKKYAFLVTRTLGKEKIIIDGFRDSFWNKKLKFFTYATAREEKKYDFLFPDASLDQKL